MMTDLGTWRPQGSRAWTRMRGSWAARLGIAALFVIACAGSAIGADVTPEDDPDWPVVIARLRQQYYQRPGHARTREQLAIAYNNHAIALSDAEKFLEARHELEEARRLDPDNGQFLDNLVAIYVREAQADYQNHQIKQARATLTRAIALDAENPAVYALLGEIEYNSQRLRQAEAAWEKAVLLNPDREDVVTKLERLKQELPVETGFGRISQAFFDIRYSQDVRRETGFDMRDELLKARRAVGADFKHWPRYKLVVLVYNPEEFRLLRRDMPDWVAGQYDGKIRVPLPGQGFDLQAVTRTLYHEYTHAMVYGLTNGRCPTWLNEGLAEHEGWQGQTPPWVTLRKAFTNDTLIAWEDLSSHFSKDASVQTVTLAYEQSHSIVDYLVERYGFWRMRRILNSVSEEIPIEEVLPSEFHIRLERLKANWRKWLQGRLARSPG